MAHQSSPTLLVLLGLRLKAFAPVETVAELVSMPIGEVESLLNGLLADELARYREGRLTGWSLTPAGRVRGEELLAGELRAAGAGDVIRACYQSFLGHNHDLLQICTDWQLRGSGAGQVINDHTDRAYDASVVDRLVLHHEALSPITTRLTESLERFGGYEPRFETALDKVRAGKGDWFTKPTIDSYHTIWFELHENLLATLGIERSKEGQA